MGSQVYSTVHEYAGCSFTVQSSNDFRKDSRPLLVAHSWIHDGPRQEPGHVHGPTLRNGCAHRACTLDTGQTDTRRKHHGGWILPGGGGGVDQAVGYYTWIAVGKRDAPSLRLTMIVA